MPIARRFAIVLLLSLVAAPAWGQAFKVKAPKGDARNLTWALQAETGNILVGVEVGGKIYTTVAKKKAGKYKGKKMKPVSGSDDAHRPYAVWDEAGNGYVIAWDTAPEDLRDLLAGRLSPRLAGSEIHARRLKAINGKATGAALAFGDAADANVSPHFFSADDPDARDFGLAWLSWSESTRLAFDVTFPNAHANTIWNRTMIFDGGDPRQVDTGITAPAEFTAVKRVNFDGDLFFGANRFVNPELTNGLLYKLTNNGKNSDGPLNTPGAFPTANTSGAAYILAETANLGIGIWVENLRCWYEMYGGVNWDAGNSSVVGGFFDPAFPCSHPTAQTGLGAYQGRSARTSNDTTYIAGQRADGSIWLFRYTDAGAGTETQIGSSKKAIEEMSLLLLPDSDAAVLFWIEPKNKSTDQLKGLLFTID